MRLTSLLLSRSLPGGNRSLAEAIASAKASVGRHHRETTPSGTPLLPGVDLVERIRRSKINYSQHQVWRTQRKNDLIEAIRKTQLKPVKRITFKFDPFHPQATSCREYLFLISNEEIRETNPDCALRTEVVDTRDDPTITVELENGQTVLFVTPLLTTLEISHNLNKITDRLYIPPDQDLRL